MKFSIITPALNQLAYLKRCIASIADQVAGSGIVDGCALPVEQELPAAQQPDSLTPEHALRVHHHIQDGCSTDGTVEYLKEYIARQQSTDTYQLTFTSEADGGMYDALNKGFSRATGEVFAWLNCDEQYLPGTLAKAAGFFLKYPEVDFIYGNALLLNENGSLLTYRKNPPLRRWYVQSDHLYTQSCAMFFRQHVFQETGCFDIQWKAVSDCDFITRLLKHGFKAGRMSEYLSVFFVTGQNLSNSRTGQDELIRWRTTAPPPVRMLHYPLRVLRYLEKYFSGGYRERFPLEYAVYLSGDSEHRSTFKPATGSARFIAWSR
ncbi:MAG: glycosyltransferase family 2 protein [Kiritimatiellales bacterium]